MRFDRLTSARKRSPSIVAVASDLDVPEFMER